MVQVEESQVLVNSYQKYQIYQVNTSIPGVGGGESGSGEFIPEISDLPGE